MSRDPKVIECLKSLSDREMFIHLERQVNGAIIQHDRIESDLEVMYKLLDFQSRIKLHNLTHLDVQFYYICCDNVRKAINTWSKTNKNLKPLYNEFEPFFNQFREGRNHLEHMDERIKPETSKYKIELNGYGNLFQNCVFDGVRIELGYSFGDKIFDLSRNGLNIICDSYLSVINVLLKEQK